MTSPPLLPSAEDPDHDPELRPSARRILRTLSENDDGEMTAAELIGETGLARGTVSEVLPSLKRRGVVTSRPCVTHPRADVYSYSGPSRDSSPDGSHDEDD